MATQPGITGSRTYNGQVMNTQVSVPRMPGMPPDVLAALQQKRAAAAAEAAMRLKMQQAQLKAMQQGEARQRNPQAEGQSASAQPVTEHPWYTLQGVARTPVHGFNMTGDYTIDPNKLPPGMRPQNAGFAAPQSAGLGQSGAGLGASPASNQPASGGFTAGQEYEGKGGVGGGPTAAGGTDERPDWLGTGSTNAGEQAAVLRRNASVREAQQQAMMKNASQALIAGMGGYRGNTITPVGVR